MYIPRRRPLYTNSNPEAVAFCSLLMIDSTTNPEINFHLAIAGIVKILQLQRLLSILQRALAL